MNFFPVPNKPLQRKERKRTTTIALQRELIPYEEFTEEELYAAKGGILAFDLESYENYFLIAFRCYYTNKAVCFEMYEGVTFNPHKLLWVLHNFCVVGFNSIQFDEPLVWLSMQPGIDTRTLKFVVNEIIQGSWRPNDVEKAYKFKMGQINHIDLIEVAPLSASLKVYAARLHAPRLQELPFPPEKLLTPQEIAQVKDYCINNDLPATLLLLKELSPQLSLRSELSVQYHQCLRSKSDAQIAETILSSEVKALNGYWAKKPQIAEGTTFKYNVPDFIQYKTPLLKRMLEIIRNVDFVVRDTGNVVLPEEITALNIEIGSCVYRMGIGGLHSSESCASHVADENNLLIDRDVASFYPAIILNLNLFPKHLGENFNIVYRTIVERRLKAKKRTSEIKKEITALRKQLTELS